MAFPSAPPPERPRSRAINLPPLTMALLLVMAALWLGLALAPAEIGGLVLVYFAFIPAAWLADGWPLWSLALAPVSYSLLHGGLGHFALNGVMLAVMGQVLERRLGPGRFLMLFASGAAGGALVHGLIGGAPGVPLVGASAGVGALYGAGLILHRRGVWLGGNEQLLVALAGLFVMINLFGLIVPLFGHVAYAAHLGGFVAGALVAMALSIPHRAGWGA